MAEEQKDDKPLVGNNKFPPNVLCTFKIESNDGGEFYVCKMDICASGDFFRTYFIKYPDIESIKVDETSDIIEKWLTFFHPQVSDELVLDYSALNATPWITDNHIRKKIFEMFDKYEMTKYIREISRIIGDLQPEQLTRDMIKFVFKFYEQTKTKIKNLLFMMINYKRLEIDPSIFEDVKGNIMMDIMNKRDFDERFYSEKFNDYGWYTLIEK